MDIIPILRNHRNALLDSVHRGRNQIDCLDYLLYKLKNHNGMEGDLKMHHKDTRTFKVNQKTV